MMFKSVLDWFWNIFGFQEENKSDTEVSHFYFSGEPENETLEEMRNGSREEQIAAAMMEIMMYETNDYDKENGDDEDENDEDDDEESE